VVDLLAERKQLAVLHAQQMQDKDMALTRLQQYIDTQLLELQQRQQSVEEAAPDFQRQLVAARAALQRDLSISAERYQELKQVRGWERRKRAAELGKVGWGVGYRLSLMGTGACLHRGS
jgi:hypothetical protein